MVRGERLRSISKYSKNSSIKEGRSKAIFVSCQLSVVSCQLSVVSCQLQLYDALKVKIKKWGSYPQNSATLRLVSLAQGLRLCVPNPIFTNN